MFTHMAKHLKFHALAPQPYSIKQESDKSRI
uniref:Uncharacterized protein n=1 Tax=Medicago truncatula TaxID=3880 RepID=I3SG37_MEDTR|nr:unknown [Medicago truncatula]